ncbi:short chain dehydrogenase, partial [Acinetobacter baumannii]|nr:short chain dehydrogenase [Acinetobacter baumannii]
MAPPRRDVPRWRFAYRGYVTPPKGCPDKARRAAIRETGLPTFDTILKRVN